MVPRRLPSIYCILSNDERKWQDAISEDPSKSSLWYPLPKSSSLTILCIRQFCLLSSKENRRPDWFVAFKGDLGYQ